MNSPFAYPSRFIEQGKLRQHYLDVGAGEPVLMVHGNPTWSYYYRNVVDALSPRYRCIVPDHMGCGLSDKPSEEQYAFRLRDRINDLTALMKSLEITEPVTLVVHDWGGMIGLAWAMENNIPIKRLVILNTAGFPLPRRKTFPFRLWLGRNTSIGAWLIGRHNVFVRHAANIGVKRHPLPDDVREWYVKPYENRADRTAVLKFVQTIPLKPTDEGYDIVKAVGESMGRYDKTPMLICWGLKDFVFDRHFLKEWERRFPRAEVHRYPDCGHYILEDAAEDVIPLITRFLEKNP
ncbi:alpha/beta fold hydrolase [Zavarzinella formosa]|uniref:alpha/beta fold hydrolase n=1 Tax=Zavarzinella formosa TaxID=360055 RepID=UPI000309A12C|nr:alpha/beta fold hydrolase [Zavarzinella formosa]